MMSVHDITNTFVKWVIFVVLLYSSNSRYLVRSKAFENFHGKAQRNRIQSQGL